jgi:DNA-binding winged helix-turn-helix (wHTH) protein
VSGDDKVNPYYTFGEWTVEPAINRLTNGETSAQLERLTMDLLTYLLDRPGQVISADELLSALWGDRHGDPGMIQKRIAQLRRALSDDSRRPRYIETIRKRGYRTVAEVALASRFYEQRAPRDAALGLPPAGPDRSVCVRSFRVVGGGSEDKQLADMLSEEVAGALSGYQELQTLDEFAIDPSPGYTLDGTLRFGTRTPQMRVTLRRYDDRVSIWSEKFDASQIERSAYLARITGVVARQVRLKLAWDHRCEQIKRRSGSAAAVRHVRMALAETLRKNQGDETDIEFEQVNALKATRLDPGLVDGYWLLADTYIMSGISGLMPWREAARLADRALSKGFAVDDTEPLLYLERGDIYSFFTLDYAKAETHFETGMRLDPLSPYARWFCSGLARVSLMRGDLDTAMEHLARAIRIYDADGRIYAEYASALQFAGRHDQAIEAADLGLTLLLRGPLHGLLTVRKVQSCMALGRVDVARHVAETSFQDLSLPIKPWLLATLGREQEAQQFLPEIKPQRDSSFILAAIYAELGQPDQAFPLLREAIEERIGYTLMFLRLDPIWDVLRKDPRWDQLIRHVEAQERSASTAMDGT